jgi:hypothetical protein
MWWKIWSVLIADEKIFDQLLLLMQKKSQQAELY